MGQIIELANTSNEIIRGHKYFTTLMSSEMSSEALNVKLSHHNIAQLKSGMLKMGG